MFYVYIMKLIGLIILLKGVTNVGIWSFISISLGGTLIYLAYKIERNYVKNE